LVFRPELLLHPNIPKPLHEVNPRSVMGKEWWDRERQMAYARMEYRCWACGVAQYMAKYHRWLEGHEHYKINYERGTVKLVEIVALCHACHMYIHDGRMRNLVDQGKMKQSHMDAILAHGRKVLKDAGYTTFKPEYPECDVAWDDWCLIIGRKKFGPKFHSYSEWAMYYGVRVGVLEVRSEDGPAVWFSDGDWASAMDLPDGS
jgi:hypothetical protein